MKKFILKIFFYNFLLKTVFTLLFFFNKNYKINYNLVSKIKSHKTSDTIFIFGSGESINELDSLNLKKYLIMILLDLTKLITVRYL